MDVAAGADLRLGLLILLNVAVVLSAWRFVRRLTPAHWLDHAADTALLAYLLQYLAVCLPGLLGSLNVVTMGITALALSALLLAASVLLKPTPAPSDESPKRWLPLATLAFLTAYLLALAIYFRHLPVISNDALTYHFPAAATWLRTGRLSLFETWFFNPANTYSPLAGSAFIAWLIAPLNNDTIASYVQLPALLALFLATARLAKHLGLSLPLACLTAAALATSQPFIRASVLSKDDLFVALFFTSALTSFAKPLSTDRLGPWPTGISLSLLLATKYTTLLTLPILLLLALPLRRPTSASRVAGVSPASSRPISFLIILSCLLALASPWYLRNTLAYHNPLYPLTLGPLPGLLSAQTSPLLRNPLDTWRIFTAVDDAMPAYLLLPLLAGWVTFSILEHKRLRTDPLVRAVTLGPPLAIALFLYKAPYAEVRFLYPVFVLLFVATALAATRSFRNPHIGLAILIALLTTSAITGLPPSHSLILLPIAIAAALVVIAATTTLRRITLDWTHALLAGLLASFALAASIYVYWPAYVRSSAELTTAIWETKYGRDLSTAWAFVRDLPPDQPLAYANTFLVYPLMGFDARRPVQYLPIRAGAHHLSDLPPLGPVTGDQMVNRVAAVTNSSPDESAWLNNIAASGAKYLFVEKRTNLPAPPELELADKHPDHFRVLFDNPAARVYEIR